MVNLAGPKSRLLGALIDEWAAMLAAVLPAPRGPRHVVVLRDGKFALYRRRRGKAVSQSSGSLDALASRLPGRKRPVPVDLRLDGSYLLQRKLALPAESRQHLATLMPLQIDRLTPWTERQCRFAYTCDAAGASNGSTISVAVIAACREKLDRLLDEMRVRGMEVRAIGSADARLDQIPSPDLVMARDRSVALRPRIAFAAAFMALTAAGAVGISVHQYDAAARRLDAAEALLAETRARIAAIADRKAGPLPAAELARLKDATMPAVAVIDALAKALPDDTYLDEVTLAEGQLSLAGFSADAGSLVATVENVEGFSGARFTAPVMRDPAAGLQRFSLTAETGEGKP